MKECFQYMAECKDEVANLMPKKTKEDILAKYTLLLGSNQFDFSYKAGVRSVLSQVKQLENPEELAIRFATWHSGMEESKVRRIFERFKKEST